MADYTVPLILLAVSLLGLRKKQDIYGMLLSGCRDGLQILRSIVPCLILLMTAVSMLRASGAAEQLGQILAPVFSFFGIPPETALLILIRPISGSAALAVGADLMAFYGPDSRIGRTAAIMLGSTETTFYTLSVYCAAAGVRHTRYAIPAALTADCVGFLAAALFARIF